MAKLIEGMAEKSGSDWFTILMALRDRNIINSQQAKEIESYFFGKGN